MGSNPTPRTLCRTYELVNFGLWLRKKGLSEKTVISKIRKLKILMKNNWCFKETWSLGFKKLVLDVWCDWCEFKGIPKPNIQLPKFVKSTIPHIPKEEHLNALISATSPKLSCLLQLLKETGIRIGEALTLQRSDLDVERCVVKLRRTEKLGEPRENRVSENLMSKLTKYVGKWGKYENVARNFQQQKKKIAEKLGIPEIKEIHFHSFRHFKATITYHKTKDLLKVKQLLGHRSITSTLVYTKILENEKEKHYTVKFVETKEELEKLLTEGFELVSKTEWGYCLRKPL